MAETLTSPAARHAAAWRGLILGAAGVALLGAITPYNDFKLKSTSLYSNYLPIGCLFLYALLVLAVNPLLHRLAPRVALRPGELLLAWAMWISGAGLAGSGLWRYLGPIVVAPAYFTRSGSPWLEALQGAPKWLLLSRDPDSPLVLGYYHGLSTGVPWRAWMPVFVGWGVAFACITAIGIAMCSLFRKQWVVRERLTYPMAQLPLQLVVDVHSRQPLTRSRIFWYGCLTVVLCHGLSTAHRFAPAIPGFPDSTPLIGFFATPPWDALAPDALQVLFAVIGATYLIPTDVSLTLWVSFVLIRLIRVARVSSGMTPMVLGPLDQEGGLAAGAATFWAIWLIWIARPHWREVRCAFLHPDRVDESAEPLASRSALVIGSAGFVGLVVWLRAAGLPYGLGLPIVLIFCVMLLTLSRIMAESGFLYLDTSYVPTDVVAAFGTQHLTPLASTSAFVTEVALWQDIGTHPAPAIANAFSLTDASHVRPRAFAGGVALASLIGYCVCGAATVWLAYRYGTVTLEGYAMDGCPHQYLDRAIDYVQTPLSFSASSFQAAGAGAILAALLLVLRARFLWWPFGPIGLVMGATWAMKQIYFSVFIGWVVKTVCVRVWGLQGYRKALPYFLGLLLGEGLFGGCAALYGLITGVSAQVFLPQ